MSQIPLFASSSETVLVDDARGRVAYTPDFLAADVAEAWFAELRQSVPWKTQRRRSPSPVCPSIPWASTTTATGVIPRPRRVSTVDGRVERPDAVL